jgi:KaiC/GvpD/RAD55 family RecA-like ATPase
MGLVERANAPADPGLPINSVFELDSVFSDPTPVTYLIEPEVPAGSVVYLAGAPESGKSTLACAWGRELVAKGHGVLLIDRDRNPGSVIRDRFKRLGITPAFSRFWVWDSRQRSEPPQPDSPIVIDWVRRMVEQTGKSPLVIVDSAISFLLEGDDENSSINIRALFNRCRAVTDAGGTVLVLHHPGKAGGLRGSSEFVAAADQGFIVTNRPENAHRLSRLTLKVHKTRYASATDIVYNYAAGGMVRGHSVNGETENGAGSGKPAHDTTARLTELLKANPCVGSRAFENLAKAEKIPHNKSRTFLQSGVESGTIRVNQVGKKREHFPCNR